MMASHCEPFLPEHGLQEGNLILLLVELFLKSPTVGHLSVLPEQLLYVEPVLWWGLSVPNIVPHELVLGCIVFEDGRQLALEAGQHRCQHFVVLVPVFALQLHLLHQLLLLPRVRQFEGQQLLLLGRVPRFQLQQLGVQLWQLFVLQLKCLLQRCVLRRVVHLWRTVWF